MIKPRAATHLLCHFMQRVRGVFNVFDFEDALGNNGLSFYSAPEREGERET